MFAHLLTSKLKITLKNSLKTLILKKEPETGLDQHKMFQNVTAGMGLEINLRLLVIADLVVFQVPVVDNAKEMII